MAATEIVSGPPFWIPKGPPFWKPSFVVVAGNSSWYCHNQTTDLNPHPNPNLNRIPNRKLSLLEMAENGGSYRNGGPSKWRADTPRSFGKCRIEYGTVHVKKWRALHITTTGCDKIYNGWNVIQVLVQISSSLLSSDNGSWKSSSVWTSSSFWHSLLHRHKSVQAKLCDLQPHFSDEQSPLQWQTTIFNDSLEGWQLIWLGHALLVRAVLGLPFL